jgi:hypothetical protein
MSSPANPETDSGAEVRTPLPTTPDTAPAPESLMFRLYRSVFHPAASIGFPYLFTVTMLKLLSLVISWVDTVPPFFPLLLLAVSISAVVLGNIYLKEKIGLGGARVREIVLVLLAVYLYTALFSPGPFLSRFTFRESYIIPLVAAALQWLMTIDIQTRFRNREEFARTMAGHSGAALQQLLREYQPLAASSKDELRGFRNLMLVCEILLCIFIFALWAFGVRPDTGTMALFGLHTLLFFSLFFITNGLIEEHDYASDGFSIRLAEQRRRFFLLAVMLSASVLVSALVSSYRSVMPLTVVLTVLDRVLNSLLSIIRFLLQLLAFIMQALFPKSETPQIQPVESPVPITSEPSVLSQLLLLLFMVLKFVVIIALAGLLLYLFFRPFFKPEFREYLKRIHPLRALKNAVLKLLRWLLESLRSAGRRPSAMLAAETGLADGSSAFTAGTNPAHSAEKRRETNRIIRGFLRLIRWGRRHGIRYMHGRTPLEYAEAIAGRFPLLRADLVSIVAVFEEALFSSHLIGRTAVETYLETIRRVTRSETRKYTQPREIV